MKQNEVKYVIEESKANELLSQKMVKNINFVYSAIEKSIKDLYLKNFNMYVMGEYATSCNFGEIMPCLIVLEYEINQKLVDKKQNIMLSMLTKKRKNITNLNMSNLALLDFEVANVLLNNFSHSNKIKDAQVIGNVCELKFGDGSLINVIIGYKSQNTTKFKYLDNVYEYDNNVYLQKYNEKQISTNNEFSKIIKALKGLDILYSSKESLASLLSIYPFVCEEMVYNIENKFFTNDIELDLKIIANLLANMSINQYDKSLHSSEDKLINAPKYRTMQIKLLQKRIADILKNIN